MYIYSVPTLSLCPFPFISPPLSLSSSPLLFGNFAFQNRPECCVCTCFMCTRVCMQLYVHARVCTELHCVTLCTRTPEGGGPRGTVSVQRCALTFAMTSDARQRGAVLCSVCICTSCVYNVCSGGEPHPNFTTGLPAQCNCTASCGAVAAVQRAVCGALSTL